MKIYFAGSITGGRSDVQLYSKIIDLLKNYGEVLTEHIGKEDLSENGEEDKSAEDVHDRDLEWLRESDLIVAEVTTPSLGVGYEIGRMISEGREVICLYRNKNGTLSKMISGSKNTKIIYYGNLEELKKKLEPYLVKLSG
ncbi:MAG: nucleoside 2-deoxyribosyltransferase [Candidatus Aenigmatarchaeota archaeon]